ncbi:MAG: glycosyltransferase [Deltaproteobacteria bacterium]|jgi:glycosyltransferase involved in cell wall biosynthesis|nr:glycosyltransferase [Deltaproteobacteria bacterium]
MEKQPKNPLVSVVIPTFNRGWIVKEAIESVLTQDFTDFELIMVDDGSTDNTPEILREFGSDIRVIRQSNSGVSAARNCGIQASVGRWIAFLDSDDLWRPQKLSLQVDFFTGHADAMICQTEEQWIRNGVRVNPKVRHHKFSGLIFERSLELCLVSPSAVMIRKDLFNEVGLFDESLPACEDYDLWLRVSCRFPVYLIDTPLIIKRGGHDDQLSRAPGLDKYRIQSLHNIIEGNLLSNTQRAAAARMLKEKCRIYANGCRKRGRSDEAAYYEMLAGKY